MIMGIPYSNITYCMIPAVSSLYIGCLQIQEEAGITAVDMKHRGILTFIFDDQEVPWEVHGEIIEFECVWTVVYVWV